ncbi:MAG: hypothetical protein IJ514_05790 [Clostridia bacterium]|nr:hypothetical protein [Clostridia bacterium]
MKKVLSLLTAVPLMLSAFAFAGCKEETKDEKAKQVVLCDFERFEPDFQLMRLMNSFGAVNVNKDAQFVKSGETSAKLQPIGNYSTQTDPYAYIKTQSDRFDYDYTDFTWVKSVSMWVYNAQETKQRLEIGLISVINNFNSVGKTACSTYELESGWNKVVVYPDYDKLSFTMDVTSVQGVYFGFKNAGVRDPEEGPVYYLDDVTLNMAEKQIEIDTDYELDEGEVANFEYEYQAGMVSYVTPTDRIAPDVFVVDAASEGIGASDGAKVLKVVAKKGTGWPSVVIPQKIMEASGFSDIPQTEWANYAFRCDVYMVSKLQLYTTIYASTGTCEAKQIPNTAKTTGKWMTMSIGFNNVISTNATHNARIFEKPGKWSVSWGGFDDEEEKVFYLDNFRFEKIS